MPILRKLDRARPCTMHSCVSFILRNIYLQYLFSVHFLQSYFLIKIADFKDKGSRLIHRLRRASTSLCQNYMQLLHYCTADLLSRRSVYFSTLHHVEFIRCMTTPLKIVQLGTHHRQILVIGTICKFVHAGY